MTQEKLRKIITASVVAATALVVFLLGVLIYQWITFAVLNNRIEELDKQNEALKEQIVEGEENAEYFESIMGKEWLAFQEGFIRQGE